MGLILLAIFILIPVIEIAFIIEVGSAFGVFITIGLIILTAILGSYFIRLQGIGVVQRLKEQANSGEPPVKEVVDAFALLIAGFLLLTPGFFTDAIGFLLLIPPLRHAFANYIKPRLSNLKGSGFRSRNARSSTIIEGNAEEIIEKDEEETKNPNSPWKDS